MSFVASCHRKQNYFFVKTHIIHALAETTSEACEFRQLKTTPEMSLPGFTKVDHAMCYLHAR